MQGCPPPPKHTPEQEQKVIAQIEKVKANLAKESAKAKTPEEKQAAKSAKRRRQKEARKAKGQTADGEAMETDGDTVESSTVPASEPEPGSETATDAAGRPGPPAYLFTESACRCVRRVVLQGGLFFRIASFVFPRRAPGSVLCAVQGLPGARPRR